MVAGKDTVCCLDGPNGASLSGQGLVARLWRHSVPEPYGAVRISRGKPITIWSEDSIGDSIALAHELRVAGLHVDLYPEADKLGKQFKYASARGIPFVVIVGEEESERGEVSTKDLRSGVQQAVSRESAAAALRKSL